MANLIRPDFNKVSTTTSGDGPEGPMLEPRVARLESDVAEMKVSMRSVQDALIRVETKLENAATKEDLAVLRADMNKQFGDSRAESQKWLIGMLMPIYLGLLAFGWQALKAMTPQPIRTQISVPTGQSVNPPQFTSPTTTTKP
jgi:hypothetical protein